MNKMNVKAVANVNGLCVGCCFEDQDSCTPEANLLEKLGLPDCDDGFIYVITGSGSLQTIKELKDLHLQTSTKLLNKVVKLRDTKEELNLYKDLVLQLINDIQTSSECDSYDIAQVYKLKIQEGL